MTNDEMIAEMEKLNPWPLTLAEMGRRAREIYTEKLQPTLDTLENEGKYLTINLETEEWYMSDKRDDRNYPWHRTNPPAMGFVLKIGYSATSSIGGRMRPLRETVK